MSSTHHGLFVHIVFGTKERCDVIADSWRNELLAYIGGIAKEHKANLLLGGGIENHIHLLLKIHPAYGISDTVKLIKANSSRWINEGSKIDCRFEWQRGYGAFSVSSSLLEVVKKYISNQREHHQSLSFREEYLEFLRRHEISFDERYVLNEEFVG